MLCSEELSDAVWEGVCKDCWASLEPWTGPGCEQCGLPFASGYASQSDVPLCARCRAAEYEFDLARSYGLYTGNLRAAILHLKFRRRERLGKRLGELLWFVWRSIEETGEGGEEVLLVPVPLHPSRQRQRGFNQARLLAQGLCRKLSKSGHTRSLRLEAGCLRRIRATVPQTGLSLRARHENVRGVFAVASPERVRNREVALLDDVMTTGATLSACAGALKRAGARRVLALTLARATPQFPDAASANRDGTVDDTAGALT